MELSETAWRWLAGVGAVVIIAGAHLLNRWKEQRRRGWVESLSAELGARPEHDAFKQSRFEVLVASRMVEIAHRTDPLSRTRRGVPGWALVVSTELEGLSDIHNFRLQRRGERIVVVETFGFRPPEAWMSPTLRDELSLLFELVGPRDTLDIEEGHLRFRTPRRLDPPTLRSLVERQVAAAKTIERAL